MRAIKDLAKSFIRSLPAAVRRPIVLSGVAASHKLEEFITYPSLTGTLLALKRRGFSPQFAIDIGAFRGEWADEFHEVFGDSKIAMVEPQESKREVLQALVQKHPNLLIYADALLGAEDNVSVVFHDNENASSVYMEQSFQKFREVRRSTKTLDTLANEMNFPAVIDFIKIDTQGYELEILKGAQNVLSRCTFLLLEVSLIPINKGCPSAIDVINYVRERGFEWMDVCGQWRKPDKSLWQLDLMFVKNTSEFRPSAYLDGSSFG